VESWEEGKKGILLSGSLRVRMGEKGGNWCPFLVTRAWNLFKKLSLRKGIKNQ